MGARKPLLLAVVAITACAMTQAAEIVLEESAVQRLVMQALFKDNGLHHLQKGPCHAYLETPTVSLVNGRIAIRMHMSGRFGFAVAGSCAGVGLSSWATVSGRPAAAGGTVQLVDIRIDDVDDRNTRFLLESGLIPSFPSAVDFDVLKSVRTMLQGTGDRIQGEVENFSLESVRVDGNRLSVKFDFRLVGR